MSADQPELDVIGIVSHDLRTPLAAILLNASAALEGDEIDAKTATLMRRILSSASRAARMIDDLLDFTKVRTSGIPVQPRAMELGELVRTVVDELRAAHPGREIVVRSSRVDGEWDRDRLAQVVTNLVGNALEHGAADAAASVDVIVEAKPCEALIAVHNGGPPIPMEIMDDIFAPFSRGDRARASRGVGLGLFIADQVVRAHHGWIDVTSSAAEGTTFTVRLPL